MQSKSLILVEKIENRIYFVRGHKVMLDSDLAEIYGVATKRLNEQVRRNHTRFPEDFMFQLTEEEWLNLKSQIVITGSESKNLKSQFATSSWGGRRKLPYAFTEHGAVMLASVLNSRVAVEASIQVVRAFIKLREVLAAHKELAVKLQLLESKFDNHDKEIRILFEAIRQLMTPSKQTTRKIGFEIEKNK